MSVLGALLLGVGTVVGGLWAVAPSVVPSVDGRAGSAVRTAGVGAHADWSDLSSDEVPSCKSCHAEVVEKYRKTGHARSMSRFDPATAPEVFGDDSTGTTVCNEPSNLCYEAFVEDGTLHQREIRRDANGTVVHRVAYEADYVIGSGNATRSYLMEVDGYVTEMPLTWYVDDERWDMSPGYEASNDRFSRQINLECMTCHTATPEHTEFTQNHYTDVPLGISCQRCHAGAKEHAAFRAASSTAGETTSDPIQRASALSREQKLSTCGQCHLAGITVFDPGEDPTTYRPGDNIRSNRTVYVPDKQLSDSNWVGIDSHPIRLSRSACYKASEMTCTTCHDPHRPAGAVTDAEYNTTCRSCHQQPEKQTLCTRPEAVSASPGDRPSPEVATQGDCLSCHMQQGGTSDVPHVTFTDHWIRKNPGPPNDPSAGQPSFDAPTPFDLMPLRRMETLAGAQPDDDRAAAEAAVAYFRFYETMHRQPDYVRRSIEHGREALRAGTAGAETRIALARALAEADSTQRAVAVMAEAARMHPDDAWVQYWHGAMAESAGQLSTAQAAYQRAVDVQPKMTEARTGLAGVLVRRGQTDRARQELTALVQTDSVHAPQAWFNLGLLRAESGDVREARDAFQTAVTLNPDLVPAHLQLGRLYFQVELYDQARRHFHNARVADPDNPKVHGSLGFLYLQTGDRAQARHHFQRVLDLDPDNQAAQRLLERLGGG